MYPVMDLWKSHPLWIKRAYLLTGNPLPDPGHNCAFLDTAGQHTWQSSSCSRKLGYICHKGGISPAPPQSKCKTPGILHAMFRMRSLCDDPPLTSSSCRFLRPQLSKGFALTPGFPTMATAFTSIVRLKHGPMLRKSAAKKEETLSASTTWRSRALSFLNLDLVWTPPPRIKNIALLFPSFIYNLYTDVLSAKPFLMAVS